MRTIRYVSGDLEILVAVPWDTHTGMIPPPSMVFGNSAFVYAGDGPDVEVS